jgi:hypothetical protein
MRAVTGARRKAAGRARALLDVAVEKARGGTLSAGAGATHALLTPAVRYHVVSALGGCDPDMPASVRRGIDVVAEDVCVSVELTMFEALNARLPPSPSSSAAEKAASVAARQHARAAACCKPHAPAWCRAKVLYSAYPHDRSVWSQLRDPSFYLLKALSVFPLFFVSVGTWFVIWLLKDKRDEYQLISFIVQMKSALCASAVISSIIGNVLYLRCTTLEPELYPCKTYAPGQLQPFWPTAAVFLLQIVLTWVSAFLNCCSKVKGRRHALPGTQATTSKLVQDLEKQTNRRRSRIFCWLVWDLVACAVVGGAAIGAAVSMGGDGAAGTGGSGSNATVAGTTVTVTAGAIVEPARDLKEVLYWLRILYGWLCLPWVVLSLPGMFPLLLHAKRTGYNKRGQTCPIATAAERQTNWQVNRLHEEEGRRGGGGGGET